MNKLFKLDLQYFAKTKAQEYVDQANTLWHEAKTLMDEYEGKEMPKDKEEQLDKLFDDIDKYQKKSSREMKANDHKDFFEKPQHKHPLGEKEDVPKSFKNEIARKAYQTKSPEYKEIYRIFIRQGKASLEVPEAKLLSSVSDPEGGFLVPEEFRAQLIEKRRDLVFMRQLGTVLTTQSQSVTFPTFEFDGDASWTAENAEIAEEDVMDAFGKTRFVPSKLARIWRAPMELLEDAAIDVEGLMSDHFARRFGEIEENAFINGDGVDKPLGFLQAGLNTTTSTDLGGGEVFVADDLYDTIYDIRAVYRNNGSWLMHRNAIRTVRKFKDGEGMYLWQPSLQVGQPSTLLGYPVQESEFFPDNVTSGSATDPIIAFGDFSFYWIVDRVDISLQRLIERYAEFDQIGFKMRTRTDGAPVLKDPFRILVRH